MTTFVGNLALTRSSVASEEPPVLDIPPDGALQDDQGNYLKDDQGNYLVGTS